MLHCAILQEMQNGTAAKQYFVWSRGIMVRDVDIIAEVCKHLLKKKGHALGQRVETRLKLQSW
jgi:hypothetical protein